MRRTGRLARKVRALLSMLPMSTLVTLPATTARAEVESIALSAPAADGGMPVEEALERRRSVRSYARSPLTLAEISQLLWAAQGITAKDGGRTAPSAGGLYPLELYLVAGDVDGLEPGVYRYLIERHRLQKVAAGDIRRELMAAARDQRWVGRAPATLVVAGVVGRTAKKYGSRAGRYVWMEVGCVAENVYLQATAIGLGTTLVGAFDDEPVAQLVGLEAGEEPFAILPVGRRR